MIMTCGPDTHELIIGVPEEVVVITSERSNRSCDAQLAAGARIITLSHDVIRLIFYLLPLSGRISVSHVCAFWRWLAVNDSLLWTTLKGPPSIIPVLWSRAGSAAVDVSLTLWPTTIEDVLACLSAHLSRMHSLNISARGVERFVLDDEWQEMLNALRSSAPRLLRLRVDGPDIRMRGQAVFPSSALGEQGSASRLQELAVIRTTGLDLSLLPPTLTSLALGNSWADPRLTLRDLQTLFNQCPKLQNVWLSGTAQISYAELDDAPPQTVALQKLTLAGQMGSSYEDPLTQRILEYLSFRDIHSVDVYNAEADPGYGVLQDFEATSLSIYPRKYVISHYDIDVTDSRNRFRRVRSADYVELLQFQEIWTSLVTLTISGDMSNLPRPPPPVPRLETLQIHYHRSRSWRTIDAIEPWRLDLDYDEAWHCPNLRTLEIVLGTTAEEAKKHSDKANPIELRARSIFWFVKGELPGGDVRRVFVRGDGFRVLSDQKSDEPLPFELVVDQNPCTIPMPDMEASFSGFD